MIHTHSKVPVIESDFEHAKDHLIGLVEDIYETGSIINLEFHLEEILHMFQLKIPKTKPVIQRKPLDMLLSEWVTFTTSYARSLLGGKNESNS